mmetsp:Transcript_13638/g.26126  ORF Transcript_13638/g.26126 Transcript_13638/m.26126 type:complete len:603 (+) Transcript_13638:469-2277(+)
MRRKESKGDEDLGRSFESTSSYGSINHSACSPTSSDSGESTEETFGENIEEVRRPSTLYSKLQERSKKNKLFLNRNLTYIKKDKLVWESNLAKERQVECRELNLEITLKINPLSDLWPGQKLTLFCVVGQTKDEALSVEPLRAGMITVKARESIDVELSIPFVPMNNSYVNSSSASSDHEESRILMLFIWEDHKELRIGQKESFHYITENCINGKIFSLIPSGSEVIWQVQQLPSNFGAPDENPFIFKEHLEMRRGRLKIDKTNLLGVASNTNANGVSAAHPSAVAVWPTRLNKKILFDMESRLEVSVNTTRKPVRLDLEYPSPNTDVCLTYNYYCGDNSRVPKKSEICGNFACAFCPFKSSSVVCLMKHLNTHHGLFTFNLIPDQKMNKYQIDTYPPSANVFHKRSFTTIKAVELLEAKNKEFFYWQNREERRRLEELIRSSIESEFNQRKHHKVKNLTDIETRKRQREGASFEAVVKEVEPIKERDYYHSRTGLKMRKEEVLGDVDSDDENDVFLGLRRQKLWKLAGLSQQEKQFMADWDRVHAADRPRLDRDMFDTCKKFLEEKKPPKDIFLSHVCILWDFSVLTAEEARTLIGLMNVV